MKYIKACPACGKMLRFPIDRGIIRISCQCGHSLLINPDDTELYKEGKFDLKKDGVDKNNRGLFSSLKADFKKKVNYSSIINSLLELKYKLQNISLIPDAERNKLIMWFILITAVIIFLLYQIIR